MQIFETGGVGRRCVMRMDGPYDADQLIEDPSILAEHANEEEVCPIDLHDAWLKLIPPQTAATVVQEEDPPNRPALMTPLSKSSSGILSRIEEFWQPAFETPDAVVMAAPPADAGPVSPSLPRAVPSRLREVQMDIDKISSSPASRQDLFSRIESDKEEPPKQDESVEGLRGDVNPMLFDQFAGLFEDDDLGSVTQLTPAVFRQAKDSDDVKEMPVISEMNEEVDDLFDDFEPDDFAIGLTQKIQCTSHTNSPLSSHKYFVPATDEQGDLFSREPSPSLEDLGTSSIVQRVSVGFSFASGKKVPPPSELSLRRASEIFKDVEVTVCTPVTPHQEKFHEKRSSSGGSVLRFPPSELASVADENRPSEVNGGFSAASGKILKLPSEESLQKAQRLLEEPEDEASTLRLGFASASGRKIPPPSESSLLKAKALFKDNDEVLPTAAVGFASASGKKIKPPSDESLAKAQSLLFDDPVGDMTSVGFSSAKGKRLEMPSKESLRKAQALLDHEVATELAPSSESVGFASAGGKSIKSPSEESLKRARALMQEASSTTTSVNLPISSIGKKRAAKPVFSNLKSVATRTLGVRSGPPRSSSIGSTGISSSRSSITSQFVKRVSFIIPGGSEVEEKKDPLVYFDLSPIMGRLKLRTMRPPLYFKHFPLVYNLEMDRIYNLFVMKGVDLRCINRDWVQNHAYLIWWKVASTLQTFPDCLHYPDVDKSIVTQLLYRYEREVSQAQRSPLKKICEGDESPVGVFVLLVQDVNPDGSEILLSDGWYSLWTFIDVPLSKLVTSGKIKIGQKIQVANLVAASKDPAPVLEASSMGFKLRICHNSTRMCRWHEKLGRKKSISFLRPLKFVALDGGVVPCVELIVERRFPDVIVVEWEDGTVQEKSQKEWELMLQTINNESRPPASVSKTLKLVAQDPESVKKAIVRLCHATETILAKCVPGRRFRLFNTKPMMRGSYLELRAFQSARQCIVGDIDERVVIPAASVKTVFSELTRGQDYDLAFRVIRQRAGEDYIWGINSGRCLISVHTGQFAAILPKLSPKELVIFKNLEYRYQDSNYGMEVFEMTTVTEWERSIEEPRIDLEDWIYEKAEGYVDAIVGGRAITKG